MTYDDAKKEAQRQANAYGFPLTLYHSPIERDEWENEEEAWGFAPADAVARGIAGKWRDATKDETIKPQ